MADDTFTPASTIDLEEDTNSTISKKSSEAYQYFTYKNLRYYCNYCSKNYGDKSTTTLWRHINKKHPNVIIRVGKEKMTGNMDKFVNSDQKESVNIVFV